ncbi:hypothetical protein LLR08_23310 [Rouxiella badensis]|uniref:hypothetical protein n=1 Tax=Rouxiella badensis TaxID=1646377 RepID=UPI001D13FAC2|nr:hypothetical protein [Rouxiella badensis]MCC3705472.1 hypothetical protein [Rouxiella badensis]MCC3742539.1 hypothetical protein [Rouxiella badensis]
MAMGDDALRDAVAYYMEWVYRVSVVGTGVPAQEWQAPLFTYLLTNKQLNALNAHCDREGWPPPVNRGITFYPSVIKHILTARQGKDRLTWQECARVLTAALDARSVIALQKNYDQQVIVLNSNEVLRLGATQEKYRGLLIVEVSINDLAPKTAYHASEAKSRAIMKTGR